MPSWFATRTFSLFSLCHVPARDDQFIGLQLPVVCRNFTVSSAWSSRCSSRYFIHLPVGCLYLITYKKVKFNMHKLHFINFLFSKCRFFLDHVVCGTNKTLEPHPERLGTSMDFLSPVSPYTVYHEFLKIIHSKSLSDLFTCFCLRPLSCKPGFVSRCEHWGSSE